MKKLLLLLLLLATPAFGVTRVQLKTATTGAAAATSLDVVLDAAPANGNLIAVAVACGPGATGSVGEIASSADITWFGTSKSGTTNAVGTLFLGWVRTGSASATITITNVNSVSIVAVAAEYSGFTYPRVDRTKTATGSSTSAASGATATTSSAVELWLGMVMSRGTSGVTFSSPTNSFAIVGQTTSSLATSSDRSVALLEKIVSSTGTADSGVTISASNVWVAYTVTLDETPTTFVQTSYIGN